MVTIRIRSWRPAMPSISGPRSTVASNCTVTPFVSGATCSLLIGLSSLYFRHYGRALDHEITLAVALHHMASDRTRSSRTRFLIRLPNVSISWRHLRQRIGDGSSEAGTRLSLWPDAEREG